MRVSGQRRTETKVSTRLHTAEVAGSNPASPTLQKCRFAGKTVTLPIEQLDQHADASLRKKYRTRKDKEFCSNRCKNRWHYHYGSGKYSRNARRPSSGSTK